MSLAQSCTMSRQREENHFDESEQRTTILDTAPAGIAQSIRAVELSMLARGGIEPPTRGFSVRVKANYTAEMKSKSHARVSNISGRYRDLRSSYLLLLIMKNLLQIVVR
jgi:hypothetical protein